MKLNVSDKITWSSAAGQLVGTIKNICLSENALNQTTAWIDIVVVGKTHEYSVRLCANDSNLKMMRVVKL